jgi:hypothetical protein
VRRHLGLLVTAGGLLGLGATALAQDSGSAGSGIRVPGGCLTGTRVVVRIEPASGKSFSTLRIHAVGHEVVQLTGVSAPASVTVRLPRHGGTVTIDGRTDDGSSLSAAHTYAPCPAVQHSAPTGVPEAQGGGEG